MLNSALILPATFVPLEHIIWPQCVRVGVGISRMLVPTSVTNMWNVPEFIIYWFCLPHFTNSTLFFTCYSCLKKKIDSILKGFSVEIYICLSTHGMETCSSQRKKYCSHPNKKHKLLWKVDNCHFILINAYLWSTIDRSCLYLNSVKSRVTDTFWLTRS